MPLEPTLEKRVQHLRWRRRLFLSGPPLGFVALAATVSVLSQVDPNQNTETQALIIALVILVVAAVCIAALWWAPAAHCPKCDQPMGGKLFSAYNVLWVWFARPRCPKCGFDPFG